MLYQMIKGRKVKKMATELLGSEWTVVKGRSESIERVKIHQKTVKCEKGKSDSTQEAGFCPLLRYGADITSLVGAPIKKADVLRQDPAAALRDKIGEGFYLRMESSSLVPVQTDDAEFDLCDAGEWPSMGKKSGSTPQLGSWSTVLKNPAPVPLRRGKNQVRIRSVEL